MKFPAVVCVEGLPRDEILLVEQLPPKFDPYTGKVTVEYRTLAKIVGIGPEKSKETE